MKMKLSVFEPEKNLTYTNIHLHFTGYSTYGTGGILTYNVAFIHTYQLAHLPVEFTSIVVFILQVEKAYRVTHYEL